MKTFRLVAALAAAVFALASGVANAQSAIASVNHSQKITTGLTYQTIGGNDQSRRTLEIENNMTSTDNCWIDPTGLIPVGATTTSNVTTVDGNTMTAAQASILLAPGQSYTRYYPYVPLGPIVATCTSNGDSLYVDAQ